MSKNDILITNIQRFSLHDGPGIRTTVFLKGCSLCCPWCSNPENLSYAIEPYINDGAVGQYGRFVSPSDLYVEVMKDRLFYNTATNDYKVSDVFDINKLPGGVTFSGGECLLQMEELEPLLLRLKNENIHMTVETSMFASPKQLSIALSYIDLFYVDIKIVDEKRCRRILHGNNSLFFSNVRTLLSSNKPVVFRVPVIGGYTEDNENRRAVIKTIKDCVDCCNKSGNILKIELIKEHNLGSNKWLSLIACNDRYKMPKYQGISDEMMELYCQEIKAEVDLPVVICKIG